jgi:hypothetical protein
MRELFTEEDTLVLQTPGKKCIRSMCNEAVERITVGGPSKPHYPRYDGKPGHGEYSFHLYSSDYHPSGLCYYHLARARGLFHTESLDYPLTDPRRRRVPTSQQSAEAGKRSHPYRYNSKKREVST